MTLRFIAIVVLGFVTNGLACAEPVRVALQWIELDCSETPELRDQLFPGEGQIAVMSRDDPKLSELEKKALKNVLVSHVAYLEPGTQVKHETKIDKTAFHLELGLRRPENGAYEAVIDAKSIQGEVWSEFGPVAHLTSAQMKVAMTTVRLVPGEPVAVGQFSQSSVTDSKVRFLIIGIRESRQVRNNSRNQPTAIRR